MLEFVNVHHSFRTVEALIDVSFKLQPGITGLLGANGAGKSTAMRLAVGELMPKHGAITVTSVTGSPHPRIGYCPQFVTFPKQLSVFEFFEYLAWLRKIPNAETRNAVHDALGWADLYNRRNVKLGSLSGGMVRRMAIAQSMIGRPDLLLLDEPTTGLDPEQRVRIRDLLRTLPDDATILMSSHLVEDITALASRTLILHNGRLVRDIALTELQGTGESLEQFYLRTIVHAA